MLNLKRQKVNKAKDFIARKRIPKNTCYCYIPKKALKPCKKYPDGGYDVKLCPYWKKLKEKDKYGNAIYYCKYLKQKSEEYDPINLIWDMVKECGVNDYE